MNNLIGHPRTLNLMVNDICNSRCKMCRVWKQRREKEITPKEFSQIMNDPLFREIEYVGVSGGEPTLRRDLNELFSVIVEKKGIKKVGLITNGLEAKNVISNILRCNEVCINANIPFNVMVSLDGIGKIHDTVRGRRKAYENAIEVLFFLRDKTNIALSLGCTVIKQNVWYLDEVLDFCRRENIYGRFRIGEYINRLYNEDMKKNIRNFNNDEKYQIALFFTKLELYYENSPEIKQTYRNIRQMIFGNSIRESGCPYRSEAIGLDSKGNLIFCSPKSPILGSCLKKSAKHICEENNIIRETIFNKFCHNCVHDYHSFPSDEFIAESTQENLYAKKMAIVKSINRSKNLPSAVYENINISELKNILIIGWYGTETAGDKAILSAIISRYKEKNPDVKITIASLYPFITERTLQELNEKEICILKTHSDEYLKACQSSDAVIMGGGPLMGMEPLGFVLTAFSEARKANKFCIIEGCGIGPLVKKEHIQAVKEILRLSTQIRVRDKNSLIWVLKITGRFDAKYTNDPAVYFVNHFMNNNCNQNSVQNEGYFACFLREITVEYANERKMNDFMAFRERFEGELGRLINYIKEKTGLKPLLMPMHTFAVGQDDRDFARRFADKFMKNGEYKIGNKVYSPQDILSVMNNSKLNVCMRFHSVLFAEQLNVPFIAIDYTGGGKVKGYLKDHNRIDIMFKRGDIENKKWQTRLDNILLKRNLKKLEIIHLCSNDDGGAGKAALRLNKGLIDIGESSTLLVLNKKSKDSSVKIIPSEYSGEIRNCSNEEIYNSKSWFLHAQRWQSDLNKYPKRPKGLEIFTDEISDVRLNKIKDIYDADIINLHWVAGVLDYYTAPLSLRDKPIVWTLHDMNPFTGGCHYSGNCEKYKNMCGACPQLGSKNDEDLSRRIWKIKNYAYQNLDLHIVTPSDWLAKCVYKSSLMSKYPIEVIPNGIPEKIYKPTSKRKIRDELNIDKSANVILFGADNLKNYRKGYKYLLEALKYYRPKETADTVLLTFGNYTGNDEPITKLPVYNLGSITKEEDVSSIYNAADVFVIPSLEDNLPNTAIEAMACGVPVVGFKIGGISDIIDHFITGYLAKPKDVKDLIIGIEWVLAQKNTNSTIKEKCRQKAEKCYSIGLQTKKYNNLYLEHAKRTNKKREYETKIKIETEKMNEQNCNNIENRYEKLKGYLDKGNKHKAIETLEKLINEYPECAVAHNDLAVLYYNDRKNKEALKHYLLALKHEPENIIFKKNLADFYYVEQGKAGKALQIYKEVLESNPEDVEVCTAIGRIFIAQGKLEDAKVNIFKAMHLSKNNVYLREGIIELGEAYRKKNKIIPAKEVYLNYLNNSNDDPIVKKAWSQTKESDDHKEIVETVESEKKEYLVSAIVSTYNSEGFITECIENVLSQTISDKIEIVILDAGSHENEREIIKAYQERLENITYIRTKNRIGIYSAWNIAIKHAKAPYCISVSTNDQLRKEASEILANYLDEHQDSFLVYGDTYLTKVPHEKFEENTHYDTYQWPEFTYEALLNRCMVGPHPMWRKSVHESIGYFDERYIADGDQEFWLRIGEKYNISHIAEFTGLQWITDNAISKKGLLPQLEISHIQSTYQKRFASKNTNHKVLCSLIIPVFNQLGYTKKCLEALSKNTPKSICEIIIIDNNSTDGTRKYLNTLNDNYKIVRNEKNRGFAVACNQGAKIAAGEYILFLNNDTEVQQNWLESLIQLIEKDQSVAAVGSKLLFPDRTIQHAGVVVINNKKTYEPLNAIHIYYGQNEDLAEANKPRCYQVLTGACLLIRRKYFENVKGFDERFWNGYEDVDLCFKLQEKGWKLIYQPESVVIHHESKSGMQRFTKTQQNIALLNKKWIGKITPDLIIETSGAISETKANHVREYNIKSNKYAMDQYPNQITKVSIIILTLNQIEYTRKCIESIFSHTSIPYEIIVVDNGSTDKTLEYLRSLKENNNHQQEMNIIANKKNLGFAGGNNVGLGVSKGKYVLMMNNDIVVTPGWLDRLIEIAEKSPTIGIVGPKSNQVSGPQYVEKVQYNQETLEGLNGFSEKFSTDNCGKSHRTLRVVGFCMLVKRAVIDKIGGMDDRFGLGNFEDDDFSIRAALAGFESWTVEDCFVHHFGSRTFIGEKIDYNQSLFKNWELFKEKWGLPSNLEYGSPYSLSQMKINRFDSRLHFIPLPINDDDSITDRLEQFSAVEQEYLKISSGIDKEDLESAIDRLQGFVRKYADFAIAYNDLGVLFYQKGEKESALKNYQKAVSLDTQNITFQKNLADFLYVECGKVEEALKIYVNILNAKPKDVETLLITGHICVALEQFDDAASFYEKVIEIEPNNADACQNLGFLKKKLTAPQNSSLIVEATDTPAVENLAIFREVPEGVTGEKSTDRIQVSIIMILDGPNDAMQKSYASIRENTKVYFELFFIENGAGQKATKWVQKTINNDKYKRSMYIEHGGSIAEKLNHAIETACGEYIVVVRDNILVSEHWLTDMIETLCLSKNAGIVGLFSTHNTGTSEPSPPINEKNYQEYAREFRARNRHRRIPMRLFDSSCLIFKRKLANEISSGDTKFIGIEALVKDFCQRISAAGYQNVVAGDVIVHHLNYRAKKVGVSKKQKNGDRDQKLFHSKWNGLITDNSHAGQIEIQTLLEKADRLFQKGHVEEGIETLLEGISRFPEGDRVYVTLAEQLINNGRHHDALDALEEIPVDANEEKKTSDFKKVKISLMKAYCQEGLGNYEVASELADQVLRILPDNPKALNLKGILAYRANEENRARECFQRAIDADPGYGEPYTNLGSMLWESNETNEALNLFERGFILTPTDTDVATAYHEAISALKEFTRAELIVREALEPYPYNRKIRYMLIDVLIQEGNLNEALFHIENAISTCGIEDGVLDAAIKIRAHIGPVEIRKRTKKKSSVSLCMIVKNEEEFLPQCLASVEPIVDEMIIVDTGSTDRTKDIATVYGAQVFDFNWNDDFAAARNFSIAKASGDWILIMDADEVISPMDYTAFRRLINKKPSGPSAYSIVTRNYCHKANTIGWNPNDGYYAQEETGIGWLPSEKVRLFSNNNGIKFEGAVHEMADPILKRKGIKIKKSKIPVHHYGRLDTDKLDQKGQAYYEIGRKKLVEDGGDISAVRELAIQATILEKNSEAIEMWEKFLSMEPDHKAVSEAFVNMGTAYIRLKDYRNALIFAQKAVALCPEMKEAQYNLGMAELYNGNADAAVNTLKRLLNSYPDFPPAQFLLAASKCCAKETTNRNGEIKELKQGPIGPVLKYSVLELSEGLMTADQHTLAIKILQNAIEEDIVSKEIMNLYAACLGTIKNSKNYDGETADEVDGRTVSVAQYN